MRRPFAAKIIACIFTMVIAFPLFLDAKTKGIKTSYKRYSIFKIKNEDVLCEPYTVSQDDWLYKIFRKKGEISEKDFPSFLLIFKEINPQISNIDAIKPGINILIPLKKIKKTDYDQSVAGTIDVPVIEFSTIPEDIEQNFDLELESLVKKHEIQKGETVSKLIDKEFLNKGGMLSEEGLKAFKLANPNIKNINIIYEGSQIFLPDPSIKSQPWFKSFFTKKNNLPEPENKIVEKQNEIQAHELARLKKYASLIGGTLLRHGQIYFPGKDNSQNVIDLESMPLIETPDGTKILIISGNAINENLLEHIQSHWKNMKTQLLSESLPELVKKQSQPLAKNKTLEYQKIVRDLMAQTQYEYVSNTKIPFTLNGIQLEASFGRIQRKDRPDLLINFGHVYGAALEILNKREFEIFDITPKLSITDAIDTLFSHLGYTTWKNPSFFTEEKVERITGIYAVKDQEKLFIPLDMLSLNAIKHLEKENVKLLSFNLQPALTR